MKHDKLRGDIGSRKRTEMQLHDEKAHTFAMLFKDNPFDLGKMAFDLLAGSQRFAVPDKTQSNKGRWKTCCFRKRFLGAAGPLKLHVETPHNTLLETQRRLKKGGILSAVKAFHFLEVHQALGDLERVEDMLKQARYSPVFGNKDIPVWERYTLTIEEAMPKSSLKIRYGGVMQDMLYFLCHIGALSEVERSEYEREKTGQ